MKKIIAGLLSAAMTLSCLALPVEFTEKLVSGSVIEASAENEMAYTAFLLFTDSNWGWGNWDINDGREQYSGAGTDAIISGDGTYTVSISAEQVATWYDSEGNEAIAGSEDAYPVPATGATIWCVDIVGLADAIGAGSSDLDKSATSADKMALVTDAGVTISDVIISVDGAETYYFKDSDLLYGDMERNGDLRLEIYNEYGETKTSAPKSLLAFLEDMTVTDTLEVTFDITGLDDIYSCYIYAVLDDGTVEITEYYGDGEEVVIPGEIDGKSVTSIGDLAFFGCSSLTNITIPNSVTSIGDRAFRGCTNLSSVAIPDSVTCIGNGAFSECTSLISITIPYGVTSIGMYSFEDCTSLASITIPDSVTNIGDYAFNFCENLTSITIPNSVASIGDEAFNSCKSLASITIPDSVTNMGVAAFQCCTSLTSITIPNSITSIADATFGNCENLTIITIPDSVTSIGSFAFEFCERLTDVYYSGSESNWNKIETGTFNSWLTNATIHYNYAPVQTHFYTSVITKQPTCTATGVRTYTCSNCGDSYTETIAAKGHTYSASWTIDKAATCTTTGSKSHHCTVCGAKTDVTTIPKAAHFYTGVIAKQPTCTATGIRTHTCSSCGDSYTETIAAKGHSYSTSWTIDKAATCTTTGSKSHHCTVCGAKTDVTAIAKTSHSYDSGKITKAATCTSSGTKTYTCTNCGTTKTATIAVKEHKYSITVVQPTCDKNGYTIHECSNCNDIYTDTYTNALGHDYDSGKITRAATCTENGIKTYTCSLCGDSYTETIKASGHNYKVTVVEPTCTENGYTTHKCAQCGDVYTDTYTNVTPHTYSTVWTIDKASTCSAAGSKSHHCTVCGAKTDVTAISKKSHTYKTTVVAPTYAAQGYTLHKCSVCGYSYKDKYTAKKILATVKANTAYTSTPNAVKISWNKVSGAMGYKIYRYNSTTKKWSDIKTISNANTLTYMNSSLKSGTVYKYKVKAFVKSNGKFYFGNSCSTITTATKPTTSTITKTAKSSTAVRLYWKKVTCTGYKIQRYNATTKKWVDVKTVSSGTTNYRIASLKKNTNYKFRVCAYKNDGKKNLLGAWSYVTVKTSA